MAAAWDCMAFCHVAFFYFEATHGVPGSELQGESIAGSDVYLAPENYARFKKRVKGLG